MNIVPTGFQGLYVLNPTVINDHRGYFFESYHKNEFHKNIAKVDFVQDNHSLSFKGSLRGLHFQYPPHAEMKLIRCLRGRVWDVGVDLRAGSPTFLRWHAEELSQESQRMIVIPEGFAHGFQVLEPDSELLYLHTSPYTPSAEGGVPFDDPALAISWPLPPTDLSERDKHHPPLTSDFKGIDL